MTIYVHPDVALYILNQKRASLASLEGQFKVTVLIEADATLIPPDFRLDGDNGELASRENTGERNRQRYNNKQARNQNDKASQKPAQLEPERENPEDDEEQPKRKRRGRRGGRRRKRRGNEDSVKIAEQNNAEVAITEDPQAEQADTPSDNNANDSVTQPSEKKPRKRSSPKAVKANKVSDIDKNESEADAALLVADAAAPEQDKDHKKQAAKKKTKAKKKTSSDRSKKPKTKSKKTSTKPKTKATKSQSTAFAQATERQQNLAGSSESGQEKGAVSDKERSPKSSMEMTVINIDKTPAAKTKKKGWWSR